MFHNPKKEIRHNTTFAPIGPSLNQVALLGAQLSASNNQVNALKARVEAGTPSINLTTLPQAHEIDPPERYNWMTGAINPPNGKAKMPNYGRTAQRVAFENRNRGNRTIALK